MPATIDTIEEIIKPLFEIINNKENVLFEEEILSSVKQIIFLRKFVSDTMWIVLSIVPKTKATKVLDTIMVYITYGQDQIVNKPELLDTFLMLAQKWLNFEGKRPMYHAAEGALLLQAIIQRFPPQFMEAYIPNIVKTVLTRQTKVPMCRSFERILFSVVFSALISNADLTL